MSINNGTNTGVNATYSKAAPAAASLLYYGEIQSIIPKTIPPSAKLIGPKGTRAQIFTLDLAGILAPRTIDASSLSICIPCSPLGEFRRTLIPTSWESINDISPSRAAYGVHTPMSPPRLYNELTSTVVSRNSQCSDLFEVGVNQGLRFRLLSPNDFLLAWPCCLPLAT